MLKYTNIIENFTCDHSNLKFYDKLIGDGLRTRKHSLLPGGLKNNGNEQEWKVAIPYKMLFCNPEFRRLFWRGEIGDSMGLGVVHI